jgi:F0F1-type ATP synthase membrane subunit b/b'
MSVLPFLLVQVVFFVGMVSVLLFIFNRKLMDAAGRLQSLSAEYTRRHEELKQRMGEAEQQYGEQISRAKAEADRLVSEANRDAESAKTRTLEAARAESERIVQQGLESRDALRRDMEQQVERRAIERACELIQATLPGQMRQDMQAQWMDDLIGDGLGQLAGLAAQEDVTEARVASAFPLTAAQQRALQAKLKEKLGRDLKVAYVTEERLVAGLTITLGSLVVDGSLATRLKRAVRDAQHADA